MAEERSGTIQATSSTARPPRFWRISIREMLLVTALVGVGFAALKYAEPLVWSILGVAALLVFLFFAVVAATERGPLQGLALGFVVCTASYAWIVLSWSSPEAELDPYSGKLPTTRVVLPLFEAMTENFYIDAKTRQRLPDNDPRIKGANLGGGFNMTMYSDEFPRRADFMPIVHILWGAIFGYLGGRLGYFLTLRRVYRESQS